MELWRGRPVDVVERIDDAAEADARVLDHLARLGSGPDTSCDTTHFVYVAREEDAAAVAGTLGREGWRTCVEQAEGSWLVVAAKVGALSPATVRKTRRTLEALAAENGGFYDGWEAAL